MADSFKLNGIEAGFTEHSTTGTSNVQGALKNELVISKSKLRINVLTPAVDLIDKVQDGLANNLAHGGLGKVDDLRMVTYRSLQIDRQEYHAQSTYPYCSYFVSFEAYNFSVEETFHGTIDVQEGHVHNFGELVSRVDEKEPSVTEELQECSESRPLLPKRINHDSQRFTKYADLWYIVDNVGYDKIERLENLDWQLVEAVARPAPFYTKCHQFKVYSINGSVFSQHESPQHIAGAKKAGEPTKWMDLLNIESVDSFKFWDEGTLTFSIHNKELAEGRDSRVRSF